MQNGLKTIEKKKKLLAISFLYLKYYLTLKLKVTNTKKISKHYLVSTMT